MRQMLNTLFVTSEDVYLSLDGENVVANRDGTVLARYPLHTLENIILFSYAGCSPALMGACASKKIGLTLCTPYGKYLCNIVGKNSGNVLLRREQYRIADNESKCCEIARNMILGKVHNARHNIERTLRDHAMRIDSELLSLKSCSLKNQFQQIKHCISLDALRGLEGAAATTYFQAFDEMILANKHIFTFETRNKRPPIDPVNAMLSFGYTMLSSDCTAALQSVGLDAYVGFMHRDKPGRPSLSLDIMEEMRPQMTDRLVLSLINTRKINETHFERQENGAMHLNDAGRKVYLKAWQEMKREQIQHPYIEEKIPKGLIPYTQALLLAKYIRGDIDGYPPFIWR